MSPDATEENAMSKAKMTHDYLFYEDVIPQVRDSELWPIVHAICYKHMGELFIYSMADDDTLYRRLAVNTKAEPADTALISLVNAAGVLIIDVIHNSEHGYRVCPLDSDGSRTTVEVTSKSVPYVVQRVMKSGTSLDERIKEAIEAGKHAIYKRVRRLFDCVLNTMNVFYPDPAPGTIKNHHINGKVVGALAALSLGRPMPPWVTEGIKNEIEAFQEAYRTSMGYRLIMCDKTKDFFYNKNIWFVWEQYDKTVTAMQLELDIDKLSDYYLNELYPAYGPGSAKFEMPAVLTPPRRYRGYHAMPEEHKLPLVAALQMAKINTDVEGSRAVFRQDPDFLLPYSVTDYQRGALREDVGCIYSTSMCLIYV
jgi:hypothetical protein